MGMAAEGSNWFLSQRSLCRTPPDAAVVAAANHGDCNDYYSNCASRQLLLGHELSRPEGEGGRQ